MAKPKNLEQLRAEKEQVETQLAQEQHKLERLENRKKYGNVKKCAVGKHPKSEKLGSTGQAACCARIHSRYFTGGNPSGLRV